MRKIIISDNSLRQQSAAALSFKDKLDAAKRLDKIKTAYIEVGAVIDATSSVLVKTISSFLQYSALTVAATDKEQIDAAFEAASGANKKRIQLSLPASIVQIEYNLHLKPSKMMEEAAELIAYAKQKFNDIEFCICDATRSEPKIINPLVETAIKSGANAITFCDNAGNMLPSEFEAFVKGLYAAIEGLDKVEVYVENSNRFQMALALSVSGILAGASGIKTEGGNENAVGILGLFETLRELGDKHGVKLDLSSTDVINVLKDKKDSKRLLKTAEEVNKEIEFGSVDALKRFFDKSGYSLSGEDAESVFETYKSLRNKKAFGTKELDVIVAAVAKQAPTTYKLISFVTNSGNIINSTTQVTLEKGNKTYTGLAMGDGPIDSAFFAIENIIGHHYELDDFRITSITEGREAIGEAVIKLRSNGTMYSGVGVSTDIIGASIRAYLSALNKIIFEEKI